MFSEQAERWSQRIKFALSKGDNNLAEEGSHIQEQYLEQIKSLDPSIRQMSKIVKDARQELVDLGTQISLMKFNDTLSINMLIDKFDTCYKKM
ncbi:MAG: PspA/IM30 family protein [Microcystaceae cyanobacterium]